VTILSCHGCFKVAIRPTGLGGQLFGMFFDLLADPFNVGFEVFQQHPLTAQEASKSVVWVQHREVAFENHTVKCGQ
jgi:hypothetical protein